MEQCKQQTGIIYIKNLDLYIIIRMSEIDVSRARACLGFKRLKTETTRKTKNRLRFFTEQIENRTEMFDF